MARGCWAILAVALLLAPGALGASLKAGGLTASDRRALGEQGANSPPAASAIANIMAIVGRTAGFALSHRAPVTNYGGVTTITNAGVGFHGGTTTSFDNFGNPVASNGGRGIISRRLGEQAAAAAASNITAIGKRTAAAAANTTAIGKRTAAAAANTTAIGGRTAGFPPSDHAAITNFGSFTNFIYNTNTSNPITNSDGRGDGGAYGFAYPTYRNPLGDNYAGVPTYTQAFARNNNPTNRPTNPTVASLA
ncbi:hypothetical protein MNEG_10445 [Monoraphidium neglectum]|uniref:Uncharacterized protein n=1 Tax=Monoraphidium neglectum TaxID=145388 RepID=A0A0D2JCY6_9CHLO|nr:hypothetical protein MNEG_10445 [Monoraphidium neglectum]KIY97517.1 hypothetical protein MNEG_10445 [Monoraphidium neglectum]|eukprot:XP_013896537.1 hypothetical protein MNEG_10445 [Monoraphidium neglectum]